MGIPTRFVKEVSVRAWLRVFTFSGDAQCRALPDVGHEGELEHLIDGDKVDDWTTGGEVVDYSPERWAARMRCKACGEDMSALKHQKQVHRKRLYAAGDWRGRPQPGDLFLAVNWYHFAPEHCIYRWTNCDGRHLMCVLPNGHEWDIDSRASNCGSPEDTTHRCWVRHGDPETGIVHVDKAGLTCSAGAGSIAVPGYHGFLTNGMLT